MFAAFLPVRIALPQPTLLASVLLPGLILLLPLSARTQYLFEDALTISEVAKTGSIVPTLHTAPVEFTLHYEGVPLAPENRELIDLQETGVYELQLTEPKVAHFILKIGNSVDTIKTTSRIRFISKPGYIFWESLGYQQSLPAGTRPTLRCLGPCVQSDTLVQGIERRLFRGPAGDTLAILKQPGDTLFLQPFETLYLSSRSDGSWQISVKGRRHQLDKPLTSVLQMWYQHIAYKDPGWSSRTLLEIREQLLDNPFLPDAIARLVPASGDLVGKYLKAEELPELQDWQKRLYRSKEEIDVSVQPELKSRAETPQLITAPQQVAREAEQVYASDQRLGFSLNQTAILQGLASFIEERAQEELNITFLNRMRSRLEKDTLLQVLFPNTTFLFQQFSLDNYRFIMDNAKIVFTSDLENLGLNIYQAFEIQQFKEEFKYSSSLYFTALVLKMINMVYQDVPTDTILINSFLALDRQGAILQKELDRSLAHKLRSDSATLTGIRQDAQTFYADLASGGERARQLARQLRTEADFLRDTLPYDNFLYENAWTTGGELSALQRKLSNWEKQLQEEAELNLVHLSGGYPRTFILKNSRLSNYDTFFPPGSIDTVALIMNGLEQLKGGSLRRNLQSLEERLIRLENLQSELLQLKGQWIRMESAALERRAQLIYYAFQVLKASLRAEIQYWQELPAIQRQGNLLALEFLLNSLDQDPEVSNLLTNLERSLLGEPFASNRFSTLVPALENQLEKFYFPAFFRHVDALEVQAQRAGWTRSERTDGDMAFNTTQLRQAWPDFLQLYRAKERSVDPGTDFERFADSLRQFFPTIPLRPVEPADQRLETNPIHELLREIQQFRYLDSLNATRKLVELEASLQEQKNQLIPLRQNLWNLEQKLQGYQDRYTEQALVRSKNQVLQFSTIMETGVHTLQALQYGHSRLQSRTVADTSRRRYQVSSLDGDVEVLNQTDSLEIRRRVYRDTVRQKWISFKELERRFKNDSLARSVYFGLLYQDIISLPSFNRPEGAGRINPQSVALLATTLLQSIEQINALEAKKKMLNSRGENLSVQDYTSLIKHTLQLVSYSFNLYQRDGSTGDRGLLNAGRQVLGQTSGLYQNLVDKNYSLAVSNLAGLVQALVSNTDKKSFANEAQKIKNKLITYGSFMAAVALAQSPNQVKTALETAAVDVGYSRVKRVNSWNLSLNAYLGLGLGYENTGSDQSGTLVNLSTPVGISLSRGIGKNHSLSIFGSILDIGPIVTYDFQTGQAATDQELALRDFIAPGGFLFWNIANSPFTLGAGMQRTTRLFGNETRNERSTRILGTFLVDVPIFNLFTRK